ncbi:hypothetical protein Trydic_g4357 [Trypoxylus dichotomus]
MESLAIDVDDLTANQVDIRCNPALTLSFDEATINPRYVLTPLCKWKSKFSGDRSGQSAYSFLELEELRIARGLSHHQVFESTINLFEELYHGTVHIDLMIRKP